MKTLPEVARKWSRAVERGKGLCLSADEMELLTIIDVTGLMQRAAADYLK